MPTNQNAYNSRVTDEALEKKFRDTFTSQGGAELVNDLYASGVIIPVVDFTSTAEGSALRQDLQKAWDFATGNQTTVNATDTLINTTGFWLVRFTVILNTSGLGSTSGKLVINDGLGSKTIANFEGINVGSGDVEVVNTFENIVFLRSGDSLQAISGSTTAACFSNWRQIADVNGNLTNPLGFTSS